VTSAAGRRVRVLSFHAGYRCRSTGACCSSGWDIPVEPQAEAHLRDALASGALRVPDPAATSIRPRPDAPRGADCFRAVPGLPHGARVVLAASPSGRCAFLDGDSRCAVHGQLGPEALPSACRDFPRVVTLTPLGVSISLSHYCPTAAEMLFPPAAPRNASAVTLRDSGLPGPDGPAVTLRDSGLPGPEGSAIAILENPPGLPPSWPYEGLDARDAVPPLLRPGVLMDWPSLERWEAFAISILGDHRRSPESALDLLDAAAEQAGRWTPADGPFEEYFVSSLRGAASGPGDVKGGSLARRRAPSTLGMTEAWDFVAQCVPHRAALLPRAPRGLEDADRRLVAPAWSSLGLPVRRWLAAKAFASWVVLQGDGLRTTVLGLRVALGVLRAEASRGCAEASRVLDAELLKAAVRRADLLLVHLADPEALARRLARL
jgi:Fe-S-cluster containining protein